MESRNILTQYLPFDDQPQVPILQQITSQAFSGLSAVQACFRWIFELGIQPDMPFYLQKNLALINRASFTSLILALPVSFLLLLVGFNHAFSLLVSTTIILCLILTLNRARQVEWSLAIFAFFPAATITGYALVELTSGGLSDTLSYILVRQGLCFSLLLPVIIYGYDKARRGIVSGLVSFIFLAFDVAVQKWSGAQFANPAGIRYSLFSLLSLIQLVGLAGCVLYMQSYTLRHEQQVRSTSDKMRRLAIRDGMTGLFNHSFIEGLIGDAINRSRRSGDALSLLMIDVDNFKGINDRHGHNTGDEVLVQLARLLQVNKRSTDYLGRWGGDELILLLTDTDLQGASTVAEKLRQIVHHHVFGTDLHLTISLGASEYSPQDTLSGLIGRADANLYRAKRAGRNRLECS